MDSNHLTSGLTNTEAFSVMEARRQIAQELPQLERWSARSQLLRGGVFALGVGLFIAAVAYMVAEGNPAKLAFSGVAGVVAALWAAGVVVWDTYQTTKRRNVLRELAQGLGEAKRASHDGVAPRKNG